MKTIDERSAEKHYVLPAEVIQTKSDGELLAELSHVIASGDRKERQAARAKMEAVLYVREMKRDQEENGSWA